MLYPGLPSHHNHAVACREMRLFGVMFPELSSPFTAAGGMLSVLVKGGAAEARAVCNNVNVITQATSLGATESLIEHRHSVCGVT